MTCFVIAAVAAVDVVADFDALVFVSVDTTLDAVAVIDSDALVVVAANDLVVVVVIADAVCLKLLSLLDRKKFKNF